MLYCVLYTSDLTRYQYLYQNSYQQKKVIKSLHMTAYDNDIDFHRFFFRIDIYTAEQKLA